MLVKGKVNSLVIKGTQGIGKTYCVLDTLKEMGLKEEISYIYVTGFTTPLQLFNIISRCSTLQSPKLFVFDDIEGITSNRTCVSLLKSALAEARGKRIVNYESSTSKLEGATSINFDGKVILILNTIKEINTFGKSLLDRGIFYEMKLSGEELISHIETIIPNMEKGLAEEIKTDIWERIKRFSNNKSFTLRSLDRAFQFYKYDKKEWFDLFLNTINLSEEQKIFYKIQEEVELNEKDKANKYHKLTGRSERSYFRDKKVL